VLRLRTLLVVAFCAVYVAFAGIPLIFYTFIVGDVTFFYHTTMKAFRVAFKISGIRLRTFGLENIPSGACIFAANHVSNLDPPAIVAVLTKRVSVLAKKQVLQVPIVGTALRQADILALDRRNRESAVASVERAIAYLRGGLSFLVFPEGTRSPDGRLQPFRKGMFLMAIRAGVPIVPVSVVGSQERMRKGELLLRPGDIELRFGMPVDARQYHLGTKDELIAEVRERVASGLPTSQQPLTAERERDFAPVPESAHRDN